MKEEGITSRSTRSGYDYGSDDDIWKAIVTDQTASERDDSEQDMSINPLHATCKDARALAQTLGVSRESAPCQLKPGS